MGSVAKRPDGRWRARYRGPDRRERSKHFDRKADAERWLASVAVAQDRGEWVDPKRAALPLGEWATEWLDGQQHLKESTRARYSGLLRTHVLPAFGTTRLSEVGHAAIQGWVSDLGRQGLAASTVRQAHRVLHLVLELAVRDGRIARNPAAGVKLPRAARPEKRYLTHDQVHALAAEAGRYRVAVLVLAYAGLRFGELVALRVGDLDLLRRRAVVRESVTAVGSKLVVGTPKTHQQREVPLPGFVAEALAVEVAGRAADALVFPAPRGGYLRNGVFRRHWFDGAACAVGLDGLTPHELRHTAASLAIASGASVKVVQRMMGHASAAMTLDVYAGLFADDLDTVADRLDAHGRAAAAARADQVRTGAVVADLRAV